MSHLEKAVERLESIEQLLLRPTPEAVRETEALLQEVEVLVSEHGKRVGAGADMEGERGVADGFRVLGDRVGKLLEGARRAQWIRMRLITSLTQTYTARAEAKRWNPPCGTINVRM
jgi:hypothetical protein